MDNPERRVAMSKLNQIELQNLRELINAHDTAAKKMSTYYERTQDSQVKQIFQQSAQSAQNTMKKLISFL